VYNSFIYVHVVDLNMVVPRKTYADVVRGNPKPPSRVVPSPVGPSQVVPWPALSSRVVPSHVNPSPVIPSHVNPSPVILSRVDPSHVGPYHVGSSPVGSSPVGPSPPPPSRAVPSPPPPSRVVPSPMVPSRVAPSTNTRHTPASRERPWNQYPRSNGAQKQCTFQQLVDREIEWDMRIELRDDRAREEARRCAGLNALCDYDPCGDEY
jgi:hypothetical protein